MDKETRRGLRRVHFPSKAAVEALVAMMGGPYEVQPARIKVTRLEMEAAIKGHLDPLKEGELTEHLSEATPDDVAKYSREADHQEN